MWPNTKLTLQYHPVIHLRELYTFKLHLSCISLIHVILSILIIWSSLFDIFPNWKSFSANVSAVIEYKNIMLLYDKVYIAWSFLFTNAYCKAFFCDCLSSFDCPWLTNSRSARHSKIWEPITERLCENVKGPLKCLRMHRFVWSIDIISTETGSQGRTCWMAFPPFQMAKSLV